MSLHRRKRFGSAITFVLDLSAPRAVWLLAFLPRLPVLPGGVIVRQEDLRNRSSTVVTAKTQALARRRFSR